MTSQPEMCHWSGNPGTLWSWSPVMLDHIVGLGAEFQDVGSKASPMLLQKQLPLTTTTHINNKLQSETMEARRQWGDIEDAERNSCQPLISYSAKLSFKK